MTFDVTKLSRFPTRPGVYLMKNANGTILYIGKAKNLRQRIRQYFGEGRDSRPSIPHLMAKVAEIDTIVVLSEKESLLLENTLIKQHQPHYNALLRDDKAYVAIKVNHQHPWPMPSIVRYKGQPEPGGLYFGPYTSAYSARATLDFIYRRFPLRQCSDSELASRTRPCILYDMKRCIAPCVFPEVREEYDQYIEKVIRFLRGQEPEIIKGLYREMEEYAESLEYEKAHVMLTLIRQLEETLEKQYVDKPLGTDVDALAIYRHGPEVVLAQLLFRHGRLTESHHHSFNNIVEEDAELLASFILQHYLSHPELPSEILTPVDIPEVGAIEEILNTNAKRKMKIYCPQRGRNLSLVQMAYGNAEATFHKEKNIKGIRESTLLEMQEILHLDKYPKRIECFDNSNLAGKEPISVLVAFTDGVKDTSRYRKYKMRTTAHQDDYAMMREVLLRRYASVKEIGDLPDLVIVDGGKGHLNLALQVFAELNVITVNVIALSKESGRHDKGLTSEQIHIADSPTPILLPRLSKTLLLLQQIRDETHRFAITFQRLRRGKQTLRSELEAIPGIGPVKRRRLLKHFKSLQELKGASEDQLRAVKGISAANVKAILDWRKG